MQIRDITSSELSLFADIVGRLQHVTRGEEVRELVLGDLVTLLRGDGGSSFIWNEKTERFCDPINIDIAPHVHRLYEEWYQFHDPITFRMRQQTQATIVDDVVERRAFETTEYYNDLLQVDSLKWGINLYLFDDKGLDLGDFRVWRRPGRENYEERERMLLDVLAPLLRRAMLTAKGNDVSLTAREHEVAALVARGCTDRDIARVLEISFATVRTHVNRVLEKYGCANRTELAADFVRRNRN